MNLDMRLSPTSVAAHMMYEQPDPHRFYEPEGMVDLEASRIVSLDPRRVKVTGSRLVSTGKPTIKLEGVRLRGFRTVTIAGVTDPGLIRNLDEVEKRVREGVSRLVQGTLKESDYELRFIYYGRDGVRAVAAPAAVPHEVGVVIEAIAATQAGSNMVLSLARSSFLHGYFEGRKATAGNLAFPFSPSDFEGGPVYEFTIYHVMEVDDPDALFPVDIREVA